ncbi:hypothetical protein, partial [Acidiphilium sp.]|uniref:hypothetical protein n=1 Tax=Acidiphilium sp. TaxID=527 RepID=UPI002584B638
MTMHFAPGDLVRARGREWVALPAPQDGILALRPLSGSENDTVILDPALDAYSVDRDHPFRSIAITDSGDRDHDV